MPTGRKLVKPPAPATGRPSSHSAIPSSLRDPGLPLPKIIVFDLDYTLWPFWVDTHVMPPLKANAAHSAATDRRDEEFAFYADVPSVLVTLGRELGVHLAVASRTSAPQLAKDLLKMLQLVHGGSDGEKAAKLKAIDVFDAGLEIYPDDKIRHFETIHKRTGVPFEEMLFFDDEDRNRNTESLGVTMHLVRDGVTWGEVEKGVALWRKRRSRRIDMES
ncbi:Magnesium-dependent phosphatase 1 [Paramyrothecium foliicola]|nr:Magnesium-dependent phosphatase 1 [Paramyrothecium foliicola]